MEATCGVAEIAAPVLLRVRQDALNGAPGQHGHFPVLLVIVGRNAGQQPLSSVENATGAYPSAPNLSLATFEDKYLSQLITNG